MKNKNNKQLEQDLEIFSSMKEIGAPDYFYTRLIARMDNETASLAYSYTLKPVIIIGALILFLFINSFLLKNEANIMDSSSNDNIEALATAYDQTISN